MLLGASVSAVLLGSVTEGLRGGCWARNEDNADDSWDSPDSPESKGMDQVVSAKDLECCSNEWHEFGN